MPILKLDRKEQLRTDIRKAWIKCKKESDKKKIRLRTTIEVADEVINDLDDMLFKDCLKWENVKMSVKVSGTKFFICGREE